MFRNIYGFRGLVKVQKHTERYERSDIRSDKYFRKKSRSPSEVGKKAPALAARLKIKDAPAALCKTTTENSPFFNCEQIFTVRKALQRESSYD